MSKTPVTDAVVHRAWLDGLSAEAAFWRSVLNGSSVFSPVLTERLRQDRPLPQPLRSRIDAAPGADVDILDVGSGPVSVLGTLWPGRRVRLTPLDPLADAYNLQWDAAATAPVFRPLKGQAERLVEQFGPDRFDLVFCHNALDHCYDPVLAVQEMVRVAKPGAFVLLEHVPNEAEHEGYAGLHQWNICVENGAVTVWNRRSRTDLSALLQAACSIEHRATPSWITVAIRKH